MTVENFENLSPGNLLGLLDRRMKEPSSFKQSVTVLQLYHGVMSQKTVFLKNTTVRPIYFIIQKLHFVVM
jgi:hypothetical protein